MADNLTVLDSAEVEKTIATKDLGTGVHASKVVVLDGNGYELEIDQMAGAALMMDYAHHEIHEGDTFCTEVVNASMANTDTIIIAFKVPDIAPKRVHMLYKWSSRARAHIEVIEGPTWTSATGTVGSVINHHRSSANTSVVQGNQTGSYVSNTVVLNPTGLAGGTVIRSGYAWANKNTGTQQRETEEYILKNDTLYAYRITADEGTNGAQIVLNWYEHTDSN